VSPQYSPLFHRPSFFLRPPFPVPKSASLRSLDALLFFPSEASKHRDSSKVFPSELPILPGLQRREVRFPDNVFPTGHKRFLSHSLARTRPLELFLNLCRRPPGREGDLLRKGSLFCLPVFRLFLRLLRFPSLPCSRRSTTPMSLVLKFMSSLPRISHPLPLPVPCSCISSTESASDRTTSSVIAVLLSSLSFPPNPVVSRFLFLHYFVYTF